MVDAALETGAERRRGRGRGWGGGSRADRALEADLGEFGGRALDLDGRRLQRERLGLCKPARELHRIGLALLRRALRVRVHRVAWWWAPASRARRHGTEAGRVWRGLRAELGEIEVGAGAVAHGHGLA